MRILIVTDSYPPEVRSAAQLMKDLAEGLVVCGHSVIVATTMPGYNLSEETQAETVLKRETINNVDIVRVSVLPHHRVNYIRRGINQLLLPKIFLRATIKEISGPFDIVIVHSPPLPLALAASQLAKHYHAKFVANIHDIFPQNGIDLVSWWQKPLIKIFFAPMERRVYQRADIIIVPSKNHIRYLEEKRNVSRVKLYAIPHWIDTTPYDAVHVQNRFRRTWGLEGKFVFFFGGVLGPSQDLSMVLEAAEDFQNRGIKDAIFLLVGDGTDRPRLEKIAGEKKLKNIFFKPFVSSEEYPELVKEMNVGVVTLTSKNTTPAVPAKLMGYMAAGVPVVLAVHKESDALRIVEEAQCGFVAISDNYDAVSKAFYDAYNAKNFLPVFGENGKLYVKNHFEKEKLIPEWDSVLKKLS